MYDVIIIGSGPAGLSAAVYAKRAGLQAVVVEKEYEGTGQIAESSRVDNYLGLPGISGYDMGETFRNHAVELGCEFLEDEVEKITRVENGIFNLTLTDAGVLEARSVIYAAGAYPRRAELPGEMEFAGKGVSYCAICDGAFCKGKTAAVLGGGDTALDDALYLSQIAEKVYLVHRREQFRGARSTVELLKQKDNVEFVLNSRAAAITGNKKLTGLMLDDGQAFPVNGVFVAYGSVPRTKLVEGLVSVDEKGYILADETGKTSLEGFFAAGDVRTKKLRQVATAVADGANAATSVIEYLKK